MFDDSVCDVENELIEQEGDNLVSYCMIVAMVI